MFGLFERTNLRGTSALAFIRFACFSCVLGRTALLFPFWGLQLFHIFSIGRKVKTQGENGAKETGAACSGQQIGIVLLAPGLNERRLCEPRRATGRELSFACSSRRLVLVPAIPFTDPCPANYCLR